MASSNQPTVSGGGKRRKNKKKQGKVQVNYSNIVTEDSLKSVDSKRDAAAVGCCNLSHNPKNENSISLDKESKNCIAKPINQNAHDSKPEEFTHIFSNLTLKESKSGTSSKTKDVIDANKTSDLLTCDVGSRAACNYVTEMPKSLSASQQLKVNLAQPVTESQPNVASLQPDSQPVFVKDCAVNYGATSAENTDKSEPKDKCIGKNVCENKDIPKKSKAELSRERRMLQEAQRAAKAAKLAEGGNQKKTGKDATQASAPVPSLVKITDCKVDTNHEKKGSAVTQTRDAKLRIPDSVQVDNEKTVKRMAKKLEKQNVPNRITEKQRKVGLFQHLHQYERDVPVSRDIPFASHGTIHPAIIKLGLQYAEGVVCGSNARCVALLLALKQVISDYATPPNTELCRDLEPRVLRPSISFLTQCRALSVSMGNAIRHLKRLITLTPADQPENLAKENLCQEIDKFLNERILLASKAIASFAGSKIHDGDVILVYACSSLIKTVLCDAFDSGKKFSVIVVDSRPKLEGKEMLRRLVRHGLQCSYVLINSASYVMKEVSQVLLGAHALLANGYMMSRVGSSQIALIARAYNVPVIVCCETYKFSERVQTDSFVVNELGDPSDLVKTTENQTGLLSSWHSYPKLNLLNLFYDVTPPQLINMVITDITEFGLVPCTSVPVVLRVKSSET